MGAVLDWSAFQAKYAYPSPSQMDYDRVYELYITGELDGVILRYCRGIWPDVRLPEFHAELTERGIPFAAYGVFNPYNTVGDQIAVFNATRAEYPIAGLLTPDEYIQVKVAGDVEIVHSGLSKSGYAALLKNYLEGIDADTIYSSKYYWELLVGSQADSWHPAYDKWVAHYTTGATPLLPNGWPNYLLHQYSETGAGDYWGVGSTHVDLNRWSPSIPPAPPPLPPADCEPRPGIVTAPNGLNLRTRPALDSKYKLRTMPFGEPLTVYGEIPLTAGYVWSIVRDSQGNVGCCASKFVEVVE